MIYAVSAYTLWGVAPIYFHALRAVSAWEILCHRIVWSVLLLFGILAVRREITATLRLVRNVRALGSLALSSFLICTNWLLFIYSVVNARTLEASFGYFVSPLITIGLGVLFLRERLSRAQAAALLFAAAGVGVQLVALGHMPWLALTMAASFALYGLVRKRSSVGPLPGLTIETLVALPASLIGLGLLFDRGQMSFLRGSVAIDVLLISAGLVTTIPLLFFVAGTQRIRLSLLGFLQYISPTGQFLMAVAVFGEPLNRDKLVSFILVWIGLLLMAGAQKERGRREAAPS